MDLHSSQIAYRAKNLGYKSTLEYVFELIKKDRKASEERLKSKGDY
ncbi:MAG TPA: hypothetical protein VJZ75_10095 [Candidatus Bathyarchaeia archaeon]|nr:hypothetical protein [Candidatus Bathyarchaeia archaeon]